MGDVFDNNVTVDASGNVTVTGDLTVNGTTTTINSTTLTVDDKVVVIASGAADSSAADGAGISVDGASATILYDHTGTQWEMNKPLEVTGSISATTTAAIGTDTTVGTAGNTTAVAISTVTNTGTYVGKDLKISAGSTTTNGNNLNGGDLILESGGGDGTGTSSMQFRTKVSGTDAAAERMRIHTDGNVGIGVADPDALLEVAGDVHLTGTTPTLTIGDAGAEDTMLVFDGNEVDFRVGLDDGTNTLEIGVGSTHGTTPAILVGPDAGVDVMGALGINSSIADESVSGITAVFTAGEALTRGEVVYYKAADSKMWKAVATASATARCVAMAAEDISADAAGKFLMHGFLRDAASFPSYTIGGALYTPEAETSSENVPEQTAPDTSGDFVQVIGWAVTADMVFFNPSGDIIEVA